MKTCAICLEWVSFEQRATLDSCNHAFCMKCISRWVTHQKNTCPLCKSTIKEINQGWKVFKVPQRIWEDSDEDDNPPEYTEIYSSQALEDLIEQNDYLSEEDRFFSDN